MINCQKKAPAKEIAKQTLAYIFGGAYQMPMVMHFCTSQESCSNCPQLITFAIYNLCRHPEYLQPLREENSRLGGLQLNHQNNAMPLLDSFLKETARLNPVTICTASHLKATVFFPVR